MWRAAIATARGSGAGRWIEKLRITEKIGISSKVVKSYLDSVYKRIKSEQSAQTGPLVRKARGRGKPPTPPLSKSWMSRKALGNLRLSWARAKRRLINSPTLCPTQTVGASMIPIWGLRQYLRGMRFPRNCRPYPARQIQFRKSRFLLWR